MRCVSKCLRLLISFSVALFLNAARAQTELPVCARGDLSASGMASLSTPSCEESVGSSSWLFPNMSPGAPKAPMSAYRDDWDGINPTARLRQCPAGLFRRQPLTGFQMLRAGSTGRIVPDPAALSAEYSFPKRDLFLTTSVAVGFPSRISNSFSIRDLC